MLPWSGQVRLSRTRSSAEPPCHVHLFWRTWKRSHRWRKQWLPARHWTGKRNRITESKDCRGLTIQILSKLVIISYHVSAFAIARNRFFKKVEDNMLLVLLAMTLHKDSITLTYRIQSLAFMWHCIYHQTLSQKRLALSQCHCINRISIKLQFFLSTHQRMSSYLGLFNSHQMQSIVPRLIGSSFGCLRPLVVGPGGFGWVWGSVCGGSVWGGSVWGGSVCGGGWTQRCFDANVNCCIEIDHITGSLSIWLQWDQF